MAAEWTANKERVSRADYTVKEAMEAYIEAKSNILSPTTLRGYETLIRNAYPELLQLRIRKITAADIQSWANRYSLNHSAKTVSNAHGFLSAVLSTFEPSLNLNTKLPEKQRKDLYVPSDADIKKLLESIQGTEMEKAVVLSTFEPSLNLNTKLPEKQRKDLYVPSDADIKKLLESIQGTEMEKAVLLSAFGTLRRGEICALTDKDISGNTITVSKSVVRSNKGGMVTKSPKTLSSNRTVEYPKFVIDKFKGIEGPLVRMHPEDISKNFGKALQKAGLPHFRFHDLRHYSASIMHAIGIPDQYIMARGPEDISKNFGKALQKAGLPHFRFHDLRHYSASIMHAIGIPDQYIMARGGWKTDNVLKAVYRNVITDEQVKFTNKLNEHFADLCNTPCNTKHKVG